MKKTLFVCLFMLAFGARAQTFTDPSLQQAVVQLNHADKEKNYDDLFKTFKETDTSEKWQAYYYAAVSMYLKANLLVLKKTSPSLLTESNALAQKFAFGAYSSQQNNGEIITLLGLIYLQKLRLSNPQATQEQISAVAEFVSKAETLALASPRLTILKAQLAEKSGNITEAEKLFQKAMAEFDIQESSGVTWGRQLTERK